MQMSAVRRFSNLLLNKTWSLFGLDKDPLDRRISGSLHVDSIQGTQQLINMYDVTSWDHKHAPEWVSAFWVSVCMSVWFSSLNGRQLNRWLSFSQSVMRFLLLGPCFVFFKALSLSCQQFGKWNKTGRPAGERGAEMNFKSSNYTGFSLSMQINSI